MTNPVTTVRIDWDNDDAFTQAIDDVSGQVTDATWTRGRSADFTTEAQGSSTLTLRNYDDRFTPDRNWHDNPSFESGTTDWAGTAVASLTAAATSISQVTDNATSATGSKAGEAVLTATLNSGVIYPIPYTFRSGVTYSASVYLKSMSGTLNVAAGLASMGTPADISSAGTVTTSWAAYTFTWTPSADRSDGVFFVRTTSAAAATVRIDGVQVNPGATANTYIEAPTRGQLIPGRPVHIYATYSATDYPQFYGYIERITPNPEDRTVTITCHDVFRKMTDATAVIRGSSLTRTAREYRRQLLAEFARGNRNAIPNPSFETNTTGWSVDGTAALARITTDHAPDAGGSACGQLTLTAAAGSTFAYARLLTHYYAGETYRLSLYVKWVSGGTGYTITFSGNQSATKTFTATSAWTRQTLVLTPTSDSYGSAAALFARVASTASEAGVLLIDGVSITRGPGLYTYADSGTGRWPNYVGSDEFDSLASTGWGEGWSNLCGNGGFETNTTGWSTAGDAFVGAATSLVRTLGTSKYGSYMAEMTLPAASNVGVFYALTGTFLAGQTYQVYGWMRTSSGTRTNTFVGIGSQGTPADKAETATKTATTTYQQWSVQWTPSSNRTDAHLYVKSTGPTPTLYLDGFQVTRSQATYQYVDTGPLGGCTFPTSIAASSTAPYIGAGHLSIVCQAVANSGATYGFGNVSAGFHSGVQYTISLYARVASGTAPLKIGISGWDDNGGMDEASTTLSATTTYQRVSFTWTPSADRLCVELDEVGLAVICTDASGPTIYVDGVRVAPGSTPEDLELAQWAMTHGSEDTDVYDYSAVVFSGTVLASLNRLNSATLSRHWIQPAMATPWYTYVTSSRSDLAAKTVSETFDGADFSDMSAVDIDLASVVNVVEVDWSAGSDVYGDVSADNYGPRAGTTIDMSGLVTSRTVPDQVGPALVARYKDPRPRPTITRYNQFPSQLQRELDDLVGVTTTVGKTSGAEYLIQALTTTMSEGNTKWETTYTLEEYPY